MSNVLTSSTGPVNTAGTPASRWLLAAVGVLGATTLALGVAVVQMRSAPGTLVAETPVASAAAPVTSLPASEKKEPAALAKSAHQAPKNVANPGPYAARQPAPNPVTEPAPTTAQLPPPPSQLACAQCGTVVAVTPVEREGAASGGGAVAGALLGGLLGNQFGGGTGKTLATVAGAVGGGYAGNTVEKRMKKVTVYLVDVRMDDGSGRRVEHASPVSVGAHVKVNGNALTQ
ncbi:MAG: glycine zipper 2TM domain-containing protein [Burkholderiales bacterium]|nr:glycine zipper 2TM domain-containing protein [Burkholderiales bacterium]